MFFIEDIDNHLDDILFYFIKAEIHRKKLRNVTLEQFVEMLDALGYDIQLTYVKKEEA